MSDEEARQELVAIADRVLERARRNSAPCRELIADALEALEDLDARRLSGGAGAGQT